MSNEKIVKTVLSPSQPFFSLKHTYTHPDLPQTPCLHTNTHAQHHSLSPEVGIILRHFDHTHTPAQAPIVHASHDAPAVEFGVVDLHSLEVGGAVETPDGHQLTVHHRQTHLGKNNNNILMGAPH